MCFKNNWCVVFDCLYLLSKIYKRKMFSVLLVVAKEMRVEERSGNQNAQYRLSAYLFKKIHLQSFLTK
jgi:hypothetical protein